MSTPRQWCTVGRQRWVVAVSVHCLWVCRTVVVRCRATGCGSCARACGPHGAVLPRFPVFRLCCVDVKVLTSAVACCVGAAVLDVVGAAVSCRQCSCPGADEWHALALCAWHSAESNAVHVVHDVAVSDTPQPVVGSVRVWSCGGTVRVQQACTWQTVARQHVLLHQLQQPVAAGALKRRRRCWGFGVPLPPPMRHEGVNHGRRVHGA